MAVSKYDYLRNFRFTIELEINGVMTAVAGFTRVTGLRRGTDVIEHRAGDDEDKMSKLGGIVKYDQIVLAKGVVDSSQNEGKAFLDWLADWYPNKKEESASVRDVNINVKNKKGDVVRTYAFAEVWPSDMEISDVDSRASDVMMESIVLQHEGFSIIGKEMGTKVL